MRDHAAGFVRSLFLSMFILCWFTGTVFAGWRPPTPIAPGSYPAVHLIQVTVEADPERARQVLESIDWSALRGLILTPQ